MATTNPIVVIVIVVIIVSVGYSLYTRVFGEKTQGNQQHIESQHYTHEMVNSLNYGIPVTSPSIVVVPSHQSYPGNNQTASLQAPVSDYSAFSSNQNINSIHTSGSHFSHTFGNQSIHPIDNQNSHSFANQNDHSLDQEVGQTAPYSEPLPQYTEMDADKLPPYRDQMHV